MDSVYERRVWTLVYVCLGIIEGGTAAVMVRSLFATAVPPLAVDLVLALVSAAPAWANLVSLAYARRAQGRPAGASRSAQAATPRQRNGAPSVLRVSLRLRRSTLGSNAQRCVPLRGSSASTRLNGVQR